MRITRCHTQPVLPKQEKVFEIRLPGKELENLLLLSPESISAAVQSAAERRRQFVEDDVVTPNVDQIQERIVEFSRDGKLREVVERQWMCCWACAEHLSLNEPGHLKKAQEEFQDRWEDDVWRIRCCPGKEVLRRLRKWLQDDFSLSLSIPLLFEYYEPSTELRELMDALEKHITRSDA